MSFPLPTRASRTRLQDDRDAGQRRRGQRHTRRRDLRPEPERPPLSPSSSAARHSLPGNVSRLGTVISKAGPSGRHRRVANQQDQRSTVSVAPVLGDERSDLSRYAESLLCPHPKVSDRVAITLTALDTWWASRQNLRCSVSASGTHVGVTPIPSGKTRSRSGNR